MNLKKVYNNIWRMQRCYVKLYKKATPEEKLWIPLMAQTTSMFMAMIAAKQIIKEENENKK